MKYIKNINGKIEELLDETEDIITVRHYNEWDEPVINKMKKSWMVKQSENIEELCDEFRGVWTNYCEDGKDAHEEYHYNKEKNVFYDDFEELTHKEAIEKFDIFYGAIWFDRGLRYVARLNDRGAWELL